jgi:hypothetical protein
MLCGGFPSSKYSAISSWPREIPVNPLSSDDIERPEALLPIPEHKSSLQEIWALPVGIDCCHAS